MFAAQGRSTEQDHFDLLPFIGIMMCLLGTLLLLTMSLAALGAGEGWVPQLAPTDKIPVLIEWDGKYAVWHSPAGRKRIEENFDEYDKRIDPYNTRLTYWMHYTPDGKGHRVDGPKPNPLDSVLDYLEERWQTHYVLFAVRPSGFHNFSRFSSRFTDRDEERPIQIGSAPVEQGKAVRIVIPKKMPSFRTDTKGALK